MNVRTLLITGTMCAAAIGCGSDSLVEPENTSPPSAPDLAVTSNTWISRADLPGDQYGGYAVAAVPNAKGQSIVYVMGGYSPNGGRRYRNSAYNVATNTWTLKAAMPVGVYSSNGAVVLNGKIYVSGGITSKESFSSALLMYDPATDTWSSKRNMPADGSGGNTGVINGKLYILTACYSENCGPTYEYPAPGLRFYRYNPETDRYANLPLPPSGRTGVGGGVVNGKLYLLHPSYQMPGYIPTTQVEIYDPTTNRWTTGAPWNSYRGGFASATLNGKLYMIGGYRAGADGSATLVGTTNVYDPATNTWSLKAGLPTPKSWLAGTRVTLNGSPRIEVLGGAAPGNHFQYIP